ncbi:MAG: cytochrome c peroxidase [Planctomycetota bacterium]
MLRTLLLLLPIATATAQGLLPPPPEPAGNPTTPQKALLGQALFWDEQLSSSRSVACGTCHVFQNGGADPRAATALHPGADGLFGTDDDAHCSPGVRLHDSSGALVQSPDFGLAEQVTPRRAPSPINAAYAVSLFLDGRADGVFRDPLTQAVVLPAGGALESQIAGPPVSQVEMAHLGRTWAEVAQDLVGRTPLALATNVPPALQQFVAGRDYDALFAQVFGSPGITPVRIVFAIAAYERTLISDQSPFDRYLAGQGTLPPMAMAGLTGAFTTFCAPCHQDLDPAVLTTGPVLDDFRNIGVRPPGEDLGRGAITQQNADRGRFRVPGLRNVALRAPYFHNGSQTSLQSVVDFYARGGDFADNRDPLVDAINGHIAIGDNLQLQALLSTLTDPRVAAEQPPFDRPRLWSEGPLVPQNVGTGTGAPLATPPRSAALGPAFLGNQALGIGVDHVPAGQLAWLLFDAAGSAVPSQLLGHELHLGLSPALIALPAGPAQPGPTGGYASIVLQLPPLPGLAGTYWLQWAVLDPTAPAGFASSDALALPVF